MSRGKKLFALSLLTFIGLVVVGAVYSHHGDAGGLKTGGITDFLGSATGGNGAKNVPPSQVGLNQLANETGGRYTGTTSTSALRSIYKSIAAELGRTWHASYLTSAPPGQTLQLDAQLVGSGSASATAKLAGDASTGPSASPLIPSFLYGTVGSVLLGLILAERLMGVPGIVLAPVILHFIKVESSQVEVGPLPEKRGVELPTTVRD